VLSDPSGDCVTPEGDDGGLGGGCWPDNTLGASAIPPTSVANARDGKIHGRTLTSTDLRRLSDHDPGRKRQLSARYGPFCRGRARAKDPHFRRAALKMGLGVTRIKPQLIYH
jgi:hypothetical protein